jgi:hypothetical protein
MNTFITKIRRSGIASHRSARKKLGSMPRASVVECGSLMPLSLLQSDFGRPGELACVLIDVHPHLTYLTLVALNHRPNADHLRIADGVRRFGIPKMSRSPPISTYLTLNDGNTVLRGWDSHHPEDAAPL